MLKTDVIRAWKDADYRQSLSPEQLASLPANPAGPMELRDEDLDLVAGGMTFSPRCSSCLTCPDTTSWANSCQTA